MLREEIADVRQFNLSGSAFRHHYMPELQRFSTTETRMSTLKELARRWRPGLVEGLQEGAKHTAMADIQESIDELAHYRQHFW